MACTHIPSCSMFPLISVNSALKVWKAFYCEGKWTECARYKGSLEGKSVAPNLLPNGKILELDKLATTPPAKPAAAAAVTTSAAAAVRPEPAARTAAAVAPRPVAPAPAPVAAVDGSTLSYYLRMQTDKGAGVMSEVIKILGGHRVRIDAVSEKRAREAGDPNHIIVLTDQVGAEDLQAAISEIEAHPDIDGAVRKIPLEHLA